MNHISKLCGLFAILVFLVCPVPVRADVTASIIGTVRDASGAVVPNATVALSNTTTGYTRTVRSNSSGVYEFLSVPVGDGYGVEVSGAGFQKTAQANITLQVNQRFVVDFGLKVGDVNQQVSVSAETVQVDTTTNQIGDVITDRKIIALPLNGRSYTDLLGLQPGVVPITSSSAVTDRPVSGSLNGGQVSVNGSRESGNSFLINGGDVQESKNSGASIVPTLDAIQEFRVLTNTFDAEYGRFGGGIINVVTKSGTNALHGSAFEFLRNEKLNGKNFFATNRTDPATGLQIPNTARGAFKRNQFGYTLGGPVLKNHLFFFSDYQGTREVRGLASSTAFIPSTNEIGGDFSDATNVGYGNLTGVVKGSNTGNHTMVQTLSQRLGYAVHSGEPYWVAGCNTTADALAGTCVFPGRVIPKTAWDSAATNISKLIPGPAGFKGSTPFYSTTSLKTVLNDDKLGERVNWNDKRTGDWSFYFSYDRSSLLNPFAGGSLPGFSGTVPQRAIQGNVSNVHVFSGSMLNEARINYTRSTIYQTQPGTGGLGKLSSFGFSTAPLGLTSTVPSVEGIPAINVSGTYAFNLGVVANGINQINNTYQITDGISKIIGPHTLKFGGEYRKFQVNEFNISSPNGNFSFDGTETGNGFADFLLGAPSAFSQQSYSTFFTRANYAGIYGQDSFRVSPTVTINGGLRWEYIQPWYEAQGRLNAIVWGQQSTQFPGSPTGWVFPGDGGLPKSIARTSLNNFSPRFGIAWAPAVSEGFIAKLTGGPGKTSVRVGTGYYFQAIEDQPSFLTVGDAPFGLFYSSPTPVYFAQPYQDRRTDNDPGQRFPFTPPAPGAPINWATYLPISGSPGVLPNNVTPNILQMNLTIQREFRGSTILTLGYVGTRGRHLLSETEANPGVAATCLQVAAALPAGAGCGPNGENTIYTLPSGKVYGTRVHSVTSGQFLAQGKLDFGSNPLNGTFGNSEYDSFQTSLNKHFGFAQFLASYTLSKSFDNTSGPTEKVNPIFPYLSRSLSAFDLTHNFVTSYGISLPKLRHSNTLMRSTVGGWEFTGITRFTTGLPVTISQNGDRSLVGRGGIDTPNWDGQPIKRSNPRDTANRTYFSASQFSLQPLGTFGSANRRFFHGPGLDNWDMALRKSVAIRERYTFEFRAEFFNVFNHTQFSNPGGNQSTTNFGQVTVARDPRIGQVAGRFSF